MGPLRIGQLMVIGLGALVGLGALYMARSAVGMILALLFLAEQLRRSACHWAAERLRSGRRFRLRGRCGGAARRVGIGLLHRPPAHGWTGTARRTLKHRCRPR